MALIELNQQCVYEKKIALDATENTPIYDVAKTISCHYWGGFEMNVRNTGDAVINTRHYVLYQEVYKDDRIDGRKVQGCNKYIGIGINTELYEAITF